MKGIVPELLCANLALTKSFYIDILGFEMKYERPEETFAYLSLMGADLMFEQVDGPGRRWITGDLQRPFGRGVNLQITVIDVAALYARVVHRASERLYLPLEQKSYVCGSVVSVVRQFVVQDPDGYLLRFSQTAAD
jgi:catechol 2,3-dioxygenase-like lactoylglutathione lyase family enzyme